MSTRDPELIAAGTLFSAEDIVFYADSDTRSLDDAIAHADLLVTTPHAGAKIPAELAQFLAPGFTRRLQYDFTDHSTSDVVRRWAQLDPRIIYVENPHPRMVRDPNRVKPTDLRATLKEAFRRVSDAGDGNRVDLSGVDAIRPVTFSFFPLLNVPTDDLALTDLAATFERVADRGLGVYERTRDDLIERFIAKEQRFTTLSFHDTMNTTTTRDGAVKVARDASDRLPAIVSLSNRGDHDGNSRGADDPTSMDPARIRSLAKAHRDGFAATDPTDVQLNVPYLGSQEIISARQRFAELPDAWRPDAVQAEFLREYLLGAANVEVLRAPGTGWIEFDPAHTDRLARACARSWDIYRTA